MRLLIKLIISCRKGVAQKGLYWLSSNWQCAIILPNAGGKGCFQISHKYQSLRMCKSLCKVAEHFCIQAICEMFTAFVVF